MKRTAGVCAVVALVAGVLWTAQESYTVVLTSANVQALNLGRIQHNEDVCGNYNLPTSCTQAEVCVAALVPTGPSCTASEAKGFGVRIYPDTLGGREAFMKDEMVKSELDKFILEQKRRDRKATRDWCASATQVQIDAVCTLYGLQAGCYICGD